MGLKNSQYQAIMRKYEQKQLRNHDILTQHYEEVYRQLPEFKSLDDSISILSVQYGKRLLNGDQKAISSLKEELAILRASKQELLRSSGFPADYLEPVYDCPNCKDTGYIGNQKCHCFKKAIIDLLYEQSNLKEILKKENFSNFALDYYSTNFIDPKTGRSSRQVIEDALRICRNFVTSFGTDFQNLFLYGDVGVGKTFLSNCIAKELMDKEYSVLYFSASKFFSSLAKHAFDKQDVDAQNMFELIYNCDCLIIDDLGAERGTDFALERVHSLVDTRISANKPMIVTTNIDITDMGNCSDLKKKRTFDRIMPATFAFAMKGTSYRMKQAQKSYKALKDLLLSEETIGKDRNTNENDQNL